MRLPTTRAALLAPPDPNDQTWLIEGLWSARSVGIIGGQPKCGKTFLALDLAVSVASGTPCLRHFPTPQAGRVLLFAAEDAPQVVRRRLEGIAHAARVEFESLDIHVITAPVLRLDRKDHQQALEETVAFLRPQLTVLDPFVRLHAIDENLAADVAPLLAYLRSLQRRHHTAVALVHHARKAPIMSAAARPCADHQNCTPGAIQIFTCVAVASSCSSASSTAPPQASTAWHSPSRAISQLSPSRSHTVSRSPLQPFRHPASSASNRSSPPPRRPSRKNRSAIPYACAPARSVRLSLLSLPTAASSNQPADIASTSPSEAFRFPLPIGSKGKGMGNAGSPQRQLRHAARIRTSHVAEVLAQLIAAGRVTRSPEGYRINR